MYKSLIFILFTLLLVSQSSAEIVSYWPGFENSISTADVIDITNGPDGSVIFATSNGLSVYSSDEWTIYHSMARDRRGYLEGIPLNDYVTCAEYDSDGNLWLGFGDGIQIYNGYTTPVTMRYPQRTLISYSINDLQSLGEQMWVAAGNSGIYCYQNGEWKWFGPSLESGLQAYRITSIAADYSAGTIIVTSSGEGQYILLNDDAINPHFKSISEPEIPEDMDEVRSCLTGGVYFFNKTDIAYYNPKEGASHVLNLKELSDSVDSISDVSVTSDGKLLIGTNYGLYAWKEGVVTDSLTRRELINNQIKKVFVDSDGRWWFTNKYFAGYYYKNEFKPVISVELL